MKIKDSFSSVTKNEAVLEVSTSIDILADDGRQLFSVTENSDGSIEIRTGINCVHNETLLDTAFVLEPKTSNSVVIRRKEYQ